jgi:rhodanese-related sulfurtransferase
MNQVTPKQAHERLHHGEAAILIDVRTPAEFGAVHAEGARNCPLDQLRPEQLRAECGASDSALFLLCKSGARASRACQALQDAGLSNAFIVSGGTDAWVAEGLPVVRGTRAVLSLERQTRIAIGTVVLLGVALGLLVDPRWSLIAGFAGAGLVFAGLTDSCLMAMMIAKMPWNR